jgi:ABC-2 type transport system permease protein
MANSSSKIMTIISHEYITKIKSKGFIWGTILGPVGIIVFIGVMVLVAVLSESSSARKIAILDDTNLLGIQIVEKDTARYFLTQKSLDELEKDVRSEKLDAYLHIPKNFLDSGKAELFSLGGGGLNFVEKIERRLWRVTRNERLKQANVSEEIIKKINSGIDITTNKLTEKGTEEDHAEIFALMGYILGFVMYIIMLIYGGLVSASVIEEKSNRIVEVIVSSVRPIDIMMGKVIGIGLVGLTQIVFWIIMAVGLVLVAGPIVGSFQVDPDTMQQTMESMQQQMAAMQGGGNQEMLDNIQEGIGMVKSFIQPGIIISFIFYFVVGYLIFATIFAGIGSAVDQQSDANQLQMPVTMIVILPMLTISLVMADPDGVPAIVLSLIPFFTPTLMIVRIGATDVPIWQIAASVVLTLGTFYGALWFASRVYKVGILMYGKKPSFKDLFKWVRMSK